MGDTTTKPTFNLWTEPWISLEQSDGQIVRLGIEQTLLRAQDFRTIYDTSPLAVAGIHRLLTAVLQAAVQPKAKADLKRIWKAGCFSEDCIRAFGSQYAHRLDLFSEAEPFLQSADIPLQPEKKSAGKTVGYLTPDTPSGTAVTHYRHGGEDSHLYCPACLAGGLVAVPAFATSGGAGIKPSINGVPPIYILPGGESLFESLLSSILLPDYLPKIADRGQDMAWWAREPEIFRGSEVLRVGYLHSLTFPARRVRLHPVPMQVPCTRCGRQDQWGARDMVFEMGESRPKDAETWFDPFAAYKMNKDKKYIPIRPTEGKATWREFSSLFLQHKGSDVIRPGVLEQMAELAEDEIGPENGRRFFRCIGMRTDMKAKVFEWIDAGFDVPAEMLRDENAGLVVDDALAFANECERKVKFVYRLVFGGKSKKSERNLRIKNAMVEAFWSGLANPFRIFVSELGDPDQEAAVYDAWLKTVVDQALVVFRSAVEQTGDDAEAMRLRIEGERRCRIQLYGLLKQERKETDG